MNLQESIRRILREESRKDIMIDRYITSLIKPVDNHKLIREGNKLYIRDDGGRLTAMIYYNKRLDRMEAVMNDKLYGMIYDMFSMKDLFEIQKHLVKWFQDNFDGLDDILEVYTFDDEEYAY